jgi:hypothetical protein
MKKILALFSALVVMGAMATPAFADNEDAPGQNKVTICHVTPGQSVTLTIPEDQANGHLTGKAAGHDINGPVEDYLGECKTTPPPDGPTPPATPPATPEPPAGPPAPPKDYCDNLEGVQWEGYDCNTPQVVEVVPTPEATPEPTVVATPAPTETPVAIPVPDKPTVPKAVPAGDGSSQDGFNWFALVILAGATVAGAFALRKFNN